MAERRFVVEGPQAVREALGAGGLIELFYEPGRQDDLVEAARAAGATTTEVTAVVLAAMADTVTPQGLVGVAPLIDVDLDVIAEVRLVAVLEGVNDPGNAGTIIRTADAAGADAVVLTAGSVDPHNAKCVRATAGSLWHLPIVSGPELADVVERLRASGVQVLATSGAGADELDELLDGGALTRPTAWVFGAEAGGLSEGALSLADRVVRIPMSERAESLNLSAAAAVCLFASARAHRESYASRPIQPYSG